MNDGSLLRDLIGLLAIVVVLVVLRGLLARRSGRRRPATRRQPAPSPAPIELSAGALAVLRLGAERNGQSVAFQEVRDLLGTSPLNTAQIIDELRRHGLVDWFGESAALGSHGYLNARGREYLALHAELQ
jgi:hypothetical protein